MSILHVLRDAARADLTHALAMGLADLAADALARIADYDYAIADV